LGWMLLAFSAVASAFESATWTKDGRPRMIFHEFGALQELSVNGVLNFLKTSEIQQLFKLSGKGEEFVFRNSHSYKDVVSTFRFDQILNGLPVFGGDVAVHITPSTKMVHGISGNLLSSDSVPQILDAVQMGDHVLNEIQRRGHQNLKVVTRPTLTYLVDEADQGRLSWYIRGLSTKSISMNGNTISESSSFEPYDFYVDAINHELIMDISVWQKALYRQVFDAQNEKKLPGVLIRKEGEPETNDLFGNQAYDNAGLCYAYYWNIYQRDSWDNNGSPLNSSVHYEVNYDNAFWNGEQMVYGDGDNITFGDFTNDLSVICHELTHAVTQSTSHLRYWYQSGSLNEAFSDIMGSSSVVYTSDPSQDRPDPSTSWIIGPNCTLRNLNPDGCPDCPLGLRFMNNPPLDGSSRDYYPDRYEGLEDDRGVHWNSGIANLAYVLTVQGGVHPEFKTQIYVQPAGMDAAQRVFYLGFTQYMTTTSVYVDARAATMKAAKVLYPTKQAIYDSVRDAWSAVGVEDDSAENEHVKAELNIEVELSPVAQNILSDVASVLPLEIFHSKPHEYKGKHGKKHSQKYEKGHHSRKHGKKHLKEKLRHHSH